MKLPKGIKRWIRRGLGPKYGYGAVQKILARLTRKGRRILVSRFRSGARFDPRLSLGAGDLSRYGRPHGYLGRSVIDLGDRHAHAIVDVPWKALQVKYRGRFDPWRNAIRGAGELLAVWHPRPRSPGEEAIVEAAVTVPKKVYRQLRASGQFEVLRDGVLARRGRKRKATNIFVVPK